ncbi:hypothetical protein [Roseicella sp. DB1501]|uniref:hypothetical protein n=1 Tax=Roseicella sp. DB1501 TaxID=2730925 RepID=UPI001490CF03|nr:hypothetical protein [Roseicella sp. DB1501]NOG70499.1 hypothetical protein [Roseicella sp. DB1501]
MTLRMVFCRHGCNAFETRDDEPECGACGSVMTEDVEPFEDAIEEVEERGPEPG